MDDILATEYPPDSGPASAAARTPGGAPDLVRPPARRPGCCPGLLCCHAARPGSSRVAAVRWQWRLFAASDTCSPTRCAAGHGRWGYSTRPTTDDLPWDPAAPETDRADDMNRRGSSELPLRADTASGLGQRANMAWTPVISPAVQCRHSELTIFIHRRRVLRYGSPGPRSMFYGCPG